MNNSELRKEYFRTLKSQSVIQIFVQTISWGAEPHKPILGWELISQLPVGAHDDVIKRVVDKVLENKKYFRMCKTCNEKTPDGYMHGKSICKGCAETTLGIRY